MAGSFFLIFGAMSAGGSCFGFSIAASGFMGSGAGFLRLSSCEGGGAIRGAG
jgi:hypothetical protein